MAYRRQKSRQFHTISHVVEAWWRMVRSPQENHVTTIAHQIPALEYACIY
jgi:hypothetical protein